MLQGIFVSYTYCVGFLTLARVCFTLWRKFSYSENLRYHILHYYLGIIILYSFNEFLEVVYLPKIFKANLINNDMYMYHKDNVVLNFFPDLNLLFLCFWLR